MNTVAKVLIGVGALVVGTVGVICLAKKHNDDEDNYVTTEVETVEDSDLDAEEAE